MGRGNEGGGPHLVAWDDICKPKSNGGLEIKWIRDVDKVLLANVDIWSREWVPMKGSCC